MATSFLPLPLSSSLLSSSLQFIQLGRRSQVHFHRSLHLFTAALPNRSLSASTPFPCPSPFTSQRATIPFNSSNSFDECYRRFFAGHSHWANIKRAKGAADIKKANVFLKISLEITTAVRVGGSSDSQMNPRLATALDKARSHNMPKETIEAAIKKASQAKGEGGDFETLTYEGRGPGGSAIIVECLTNNRHRSAQLVRTAFTKNGGTISAGGSSSFLFTKKGIIIFQKGDRQEEQVMDDAMELGASELDFREGSDEVLIETEGEGKVQEVMRLKTGLTSKGYLVISAQVVTVPTDTLELEDEEELKTFQKLVDALEDLEDVHNVYHNVAL